MKRGEYNILKRKKWEYYSGKSDPEVYRENPFDFKVLKQICISILILIRNW